MNEPLLAPSISWRIARAGGVLRSLMLFVCGAVGLAVAALLLEPQALVAVTRPPQPASNGQRAHEEFAATLAGLIGEGVEVLAISNHSPESAASIVVWMNDDEDPGVITPGEIAVISHSQLLRTVTVYTLDSTMLETDDASQSGRPHPQPQAPNPQSTIAAPQSGGTTRALRLSGPLDRVAVTAPAFCDRWRAAPLVQPRTIASGLSDMRVESTGESENGLSVLRLRLRWSSDSADGAGEAVALFRSAASAP